MKQLLIAFLFAASLVSAKAGATGISEVPKTLAIGSAAPDFTLKGVDDKSYSLASFRDARVLAIVFTCNHCPTAQAYEGRIKQMVSDYASKGVAVVAISPNSVQGLRLDELGYTDVGDSFEDMKIRARDDKFNFPYLYDGETQEVSRAYGPVATPHIFIFDAQRKLRYQGRIDDTEDQRKTPRNTDARNAIDALLSGGEVPVTTTKVFGCSTKWAEKSEWVKKEDEDWAKRPVKLETIDATGIKELLKNNSDKLRLINIWATWCGPCVTEFPEFVIMSKMYTLRDFEFISISADNSDKREKVLGFLKDKQSAGKNYIFKGDDKYKLIEAVDPGWAGGLPYTILVEPGGKIVYAQQGRINPLEMRRRIVEHPLIGRTY